MRVFHVYGPMQACTVGFSGVLFALKYVLARRSPGVTNVRGAKKKLGRMSEWCSQKIVRFPFLCAYSVREN